MTQFSPGKLYRLPETDWCRDFRYAFVLRTTLDKIIDPTPGLYLSCDTMMFLCHMGEHNVFSQGNDIFVFYHGYVERTLQRIT